MFASSCELLLTRPLIFRIRFKLYLYSMHRALIISHLFRDCALEARCYYLEEYMNKGEIKYLAIFPALSTSRPHVPDELTALLSLHLSAVSGCDVCF